MHSKAANPAQVHRVDDTRIADIKDVATPATVVAEFPASTRSVATVATCRRIIHRILQGEDDRLIVVAGPCSIHDPEAALDYAGRLRELAAKHKENLLLVMRVYFEKPRTTVGWKGLINDPELDQSFNINKGLRLARKLLLDINESGMPAGTEYLDIITPQYVTDLVSWGAIGARTTESQVHREVASGLSCPVGFKNGTNGNLQIAVDAIGAATRPHHFLSMTKQGHSAIFSTKGNPDCHIILRGGRQPNYSAESVDRACALLHKAGLPGKVMIDCSHANSEKQPHKQMQVGASVAAQLAGGEERIIGIMVESHLVGGRQNVVTGRSLTYGQSITDACLGWEQSVALIEQVSEAVWARKKSRHRIPERNH